MLRHIDRNGAKSVLLLAFARNYRRAEQVVIKVVLRSTTAIVVDVVLLFDEQGYLLEAVGDQDRILASQDLNLNKGALWAEGEVGTNGAGTTLVLGRPFQVFLGKSETISSQSVPGFDAEIASRALGSVADEVSSAR